MIKPGAFHRIAHKLWQVRVADEADPAAGFSIVRAHEEPDYGVHDPIAGEPVDDTGYPFHSAKTASIRPLRVAFVREGQVQEGVVLVMHPDESMLVQPDDGAAPVDVAPEELVEPGPAPADADDVMLPETELPATSLQSIVDEMRKLVGMSKSAANFNTDFRPGAVIESTKAFDPSLMSQTDLTIPAGAMLRVDGLHGPSADQGYAPGKLPLVEPDDPDSFANSRIRVRPLDPRFKPGEIVPGYEYVLLTPQEFASNFVAKPSMQAPGKAPPGPQHAPPTGSGAKTNPGRPRPTTDITEPGFRPEITTVGPTDRLWSEEDEGPSWATPTVVNGR